MSWGSTSGDHLAKLSVVTLVFLPVQWGKRSTRPGRWFGQSYTHLSQTWYDRTLLRGLQLHLQEQKSAPSKSEADTDEKSMDYPSSPTSSTPSSSGKGKGSEEREVGCRARRSLSFNWETAVFCLKLLIKVTLHGSVFTVVILNVLCLLFSYSMSCMSL